MNEIVERFLQVETQEEKTQIYLKEVYEKGVHEQFKLAIKYNLKKRDKQNKKYYYLITFTLKPDVDVVDIIIENYIIQRLKRKALNIIKCGFVKEYTKNGVAHWHAAVISTKYISKDRFKYYEKLYGIVDIDKNYSQNYEFMNTYINKSNTSRLIIGGVSS